MYTPVQNTLFGESQTEPQRPIKQFCDLVNTLEKVKGDATGKYTQRMLPEGIKLDLFIANPDNFGLIFMIRTGSAQYSKKVLSMIKHKGFQSDNGRLINTNTGEIIPVRTEREFYKITGIIWDDPINRND